MIIAISNQKGGTGKSTTAQAIATGMAYKGRKALAIDLDPQGNITFGMGGIGSGIGSYELLTGKAVPSQTIQHTEQGDIITANATLAAADTMLRGNRRLYALRTALQPIKEVYDVIVIDCPPTLNVLLLNALTAAEKVIIPITSDMYALQGLYQLAQTIREAQTMNGDLKIGGVLFTRHSWRTVLSRDLTDVIKGKCHSLNMPVYKTVIHEAVVIREAQTQRESIFNYAPRSKPAKDYLQLLDELGL